MGKINFVGPLKYMYFTVYCSFHLESHGRGRELGLALHPAPAKARGVPGQRLPVKASGSMKIHSMV